jgi:hypothetical protein
MRPSVRTATNVRSVSTSESRVFGALVLLVGAWVVAIVAYDIYLHPADPEPVGTAIIEISGTEGIDFRGTVGTVRDEHEIEGTTPLTFTTPYRRADYVAVNISPMWQKNQGTLKAEIKKVIANAKDKTLEKEQTTGGGVFLIWKLSHSEL